MHQRIQVDHETEMTVALRNSAKRRQRQRQMEKASRKQLRPRAFADYLADKLKGSEKGLVSRPFTVDTRRLKEDVEAAIRQMESNKAIGLDGIHVKMLKANPGASSELLTTIWQVVGKTGIVSHSWIKDTIVPLFKGKGDQQEPANWRPLCILSHARKLVEKAVVMELDRTFVTDKAQYGFQSIIQVTQAALSVLVAI